ncbi:MAG: PKD domain-containing protein, partial [Bacteroidales bacterium]|nr:PKD domain-containing protein [Bacteroidales bacterium]
YTQPGGYNVYLSMTDQNGCNSSQQAYVRVRIATDHIVTVNPPSPICTGDTLFIDATYSPSSIIVTTGSVGITQTQMYNTVTYIPDGPNCPQQCYGTPVTFTNFPPGATIHSSSDIESICINMEHSFAGDLSFRIICPNGQSVVLDSYDNSGGAYLGQAADQDCGACSSNPPGCQQGTPWTYCWSEIFPQQGLLNNLDAGTSPIPATNTTNHTGYLTPQNPLSGLIGCPLNGTWSIEICDNWGIDDGWVFWWSLTLQNQAQLSGWTYTVPVNYVEFLGYNFTQLSDTTGYMIADSIGTFPYNVIVHDIFGCTYTANFNVQVGGVVPPVLGSDTSICQGNSVSITAHGGQSYLWNNGQTTATINVTPSQTTSYMVTVTAGNGCTLTDQITVNVIVPPQANAGQDANVCAHSYTLQATPTVGTGTWTYNGPGTANFTNINNPNATVTVSTDGLYQFIWTETNNGCTSKDTVVIRFTTQPTANAGNDITVCQLNTSLNAIPSVGTGTWTQISGPGTLNFANVNNPQTSINTTTQGSYILQWTEDNGYGCTSNDIVNVTLWQQPTANAGIFDSICSLTYPNMNAIPSVGQGTWSQLSGPGASQFTNIHSATSSVTVSQYGIYQFIWTENNNGCISSDTVIKIFNYIPTSTFTVTPINCFQDVATVTFTGMVDSAVVYNWNFGNANVINGSNGGPYQINFSQNGNFPISLTVSQHGCVSNPTTIIVNNPPLLQVSLQKQDISCFGAMDGKIYTTVTGGTPPYSYHWSNGIPNSFIANASQGYYMLTVTDSKGCKAYDTTFIHEPTKLFIDIPDTIFLCKDSSVNITASVTGGTYPYTLLWNTGQVQQTITVSPQQTTYYYVTVTDANQCQAFDNLLVYIYPPLVLQYSTTNDSICPGELFTIFPSVSGGNGGPYQYFINQQSVSLPIHLYPNFSQAYQLTVKDGSNYQTKVNIPVQVYPLPPLNPSSDVIAGCEPLAVTFNDGSPDEGQTYIWDFGDGESSYIKNPTHIFENEGTYTITITVQNIFGCKVTNIYPNWITVYPNPVARFEKNPLRANILEPVFDFINYSSLADSIQWYFGDGDSTNTTNPTHVYPSQPGTYQVMLVVYTNKGCVDTATGYVHIDDIYTLYAPTAFSPDGDGINEYFKIFAHGIDKETFSIVIYDRWGEIIWESKNIEEGWDGKVKNGKIAPVGSYTWLLKCRDFNGILHEESGVVNIIR